LEREPCPSLERKKSEFTTVMIQPPQLFEALMNFACLSMIAFHSFAAFRPFLAPYIAP
jgi:hypothetical protein